MGYIVISDTVLTQQELVDIIWDANIKDPDNENVMLEYFFKGIGWDVDEEFFVQQLKERKPFEYLILTLDELRHILKFTSNYKCSRAALCKLLRGG